MIEDPITVANNFKLVYSHFKNFVINSPNKINNQIKKILKKGEMEIEEPKKEKK